MNRKKVIHCRCTEEEQKAIAKAAEKAGQSITQFVISAALAKTPAPAD